MHGPETQKALIRRLATGFYRYLQGEGLDIGYRGDVKDAEPVTHKAIGIDLDYDNYDGVTLPFQDNSQDFVYSSHCLEHIMDNEQAVQEWFRVVKENGYLIIVVPHQFLYEKKLYIPSRFNDDHKNFYTPFYLMMIVEEALPPNSYRVRLLQDCDKDFDYSIPPEQHSRGEYQIELVLQKIKQPTWSLS